MSEQDQDPQAQLPQGVRGEFDAKVLKDYAPALDSKDPLLRIDVGSFEGPLDLLLHIIRRDAIDIFDIPVSQICKSYVQTLRRMRELNIDIAAEFLLMAATLVHLKSKMLLPKELQEGEEEDEDEGDPRADLVRRLLEYQKYRRASEMLDARGRLGRDIFGRPPLVPETPTGLPELAEMDSMDLVRVLARIFSRSSKPVVHEVIAERMSIGARINELIEICRSREHLTFDEMLAYGEEPILQSKRVITLLSLLEMARLHLVDLLQPRDGGTIYVTPHHDNLEVDPEEIKAAVDEDEPGSNGSSGAAGNIDVQ